MSRDRFNAVMSHLMWSEQPETRPEGMSSEAHRRLLVEDCVKNFNLHHQHFFLPSWLTCVDESMALWCVGVGLEGTGSMWDVELPTCFAIDGKPEDGLGIQNSCCAKIGIMSQLKLVKTAVMNEK